MSDRLKKIFSEKEPKTKLISYFVGCYPDYDQSLCLMKEAIDNGADILVIGRPITDSKDPVKTIDNILKNIKQ